MPFFPERPSAVCMLGWVGHRNGDRDCEPAQLTEDHAIAGRGRGKNWGGLRPEPPNPATAAPWRGFAIPERGKMRKGLEYLNIAEKCQNLASQATEPRVKKKLESIARSLETVAARRAKQLGKLPKAPRVRSR